MDMHGTILFHRPKETPATAFGTHHRQWQSIPIELSVEEATVTDSPRPSEKFTKTWKQPLIAHSVKNNAAITIKRSVYSRNCGNQKIRKES